MMQEFGSLDAALAAAIGEDDALRRELRAAFIEAADAHLDGLAAASDAEGWTTASWRLHGLAASFGAIELMNAAAGAAEIGAPHRATLVRLRSLLAGLATAR